MATCKDCLHLEACKQWYTKLPDKYHDGCDLFKDRTRFVELPCRVGDTIYIVVYLKNRTPSHIVERKCTGIHITEKVFGFRSEKASYYLVTNTDIGHAQHIPFREIGKTVFLTREAAEKALAERMKQ